MHSGWQGIKLGSKCAYAGEHCRQLSWSINDAALCRHCSACAHTQCVSRRLGHPDREEDFRRGGQRGIQGVLPGQGRCKLPCPCLYCVCSCCFVKFGLLYVLCCFGFALKVGCFYRECVLGCFVVVSMLACLCLVHVTSLPLSVYGVWPFLF